VVRFVVCLVTAQARAPWQREDAPPAARLRRIDAGLAFRDFLGEAAERGAGGGFGEVGGSGGGASTCSPGVQNGTQFSVVVRRTCLRATRAHRDSPRPTKIGGRKQGFVTAFAWSGVRRPAPRAGLRTLALRVPGPRHRSPTRRWRVFTAPRSRAATPGPAVTRWLVSYPESSADGRRRAGRSPTARSRIRGAAEAAGGAGSSENDGGFNFDRPSGGTSFAETERNSQPFAIRTARPSGRDESTFQLDVITTRALCRAASRGGSTGGNARAVPGGSFCPEWPPGKACRDL